MMLTLIQDAMKTFESPPKRFIPFSIRRPVLVQKATNAARHTVLDLTNIAVVLKAHPLSECRHVKKALQNRVPVAHVDPIV